MENGLDSKEEIEIEGPNIMITGTPGTGKTSLSQALSSATSMNYVDVGALIKHKNLHQGRDEEFDAFILDEDKVCDELEDVMAKGNNIVDFHSCDFFPERWFDLVVVLKTDNTILFARLEKRGYLQKKITENIECEIMQVVLEQARDSYKEDIIFELQSDTVQDMDSNLDKLTQWVQNWKHLD